MIQPTITFAVSTGSLYPIPTIQSIQKLQILGMTDVELTLQSNEFCLTFERELSMPSLPALLEQIQAGGLRVLSVHAPMISAGHSYNLRARREYLAHTVEVCRLLGGKLAVIHPFHLLRNHEDALNYLSQEISLRTALLPEIHEVFEQAHAANVVLALENIQDWLDEVFFNTPQNVLRFLGELNHPCMGFTLDLMHAQVSGYLHQFLHALSEYIVNIHAADLLPPTKRVPVGRGIISWQSLVPAIKALPHLKQITLELSTPHPDELTSSLELLSSWLS